MLVSNVGQVSGVLWVIHKLEGDNLTESCKNPSVIDVRGITFDLLWKSRNIKIVLGCFHYTSLPCLIGQELHRKGLFDSLV